MKLKLLLLIPFITITLNAQQREYTAFLKQALEAVKNYDEENFHKNLLYFITAMEKDEVTPEMLTKENFELYSACIAESFIRELGFTEELHSQLIAFLNHKIEEHPNHMYYLGCLYKQGMGDYIQATYWFTKATEKGIVQAMTELGDIYLNGFIGTEDYQMAKHWFEKAVDLGNADAMYKLGLMYENGYGLEQNYTKAKEWYENAIKNGNTNALVYLSWLYYDGSGVKKDEEKARQLCQKAIETGNPLYEELCNYVFD